MGKPAQTPKTGGLSARKRAAFIGVCVLFPLLLVGLVELGLRLAGFGGAPSTLRVIGPVDPGEPTSGQLVTTDAAGPGSYFFRNRDRPGAIGLFSFETPKPEGTFRVMLFGGSAIKGFPQPEAFTAASFLERMLSDALPEVDVEVLNFGTTAVASYPVLGIMREALAYEPDLVIVYAGNNEYFGAFGVASLNAGARSAWAMDAQRFFQTTGIGEAIGSLAAPRSSGESRTLMERMIGQAFVGVGDPMRQAAAANLERHLIAMGQACGSAGVPMLVCTLACNERDMAPLGEPDWTGVLGGERAQAEALLEKVTTVRAEPAEARAQLAELRRLAPAHARASFFYAQSLRATGDTGAGEAFDNALRFDTMPWRPPPESNAAIRRAASNGAGVLVDVAAAFREASRGGRVGWELMDDHVHFSIQGQLLLARTLAEAALRSDPTAAARLRSDEDYLREAGDNPFDRFGVAHQMRVLMSVPFIEETNPGAAERFDRLARSFVSVMPPELRETMTLWQDARTSAGGVRRPASGMAAKAFLRMGRPGDALGLLRAAVGSVPAYSSLSLEYEYLELALTAAAAGAEVVEGAAAERARAAISRGAFLLANTPVRTGYTERHIGRLHQLLGEWEEAVPFLEMARAGLGGTDLVAADQALVLSLVRTGRGDEARAIVERGVRESGEFSAAYERMRALLPG